MNNFEVTIDGYDLKVGSFIFSGGEVQIRLKNFPSFVPQTVNVKANLRSSDDVMALLMITNALRKKFPGIDISATIPYMPYARQDRVCYPGEAFSLEVMAGLINAQGYSRVEVWDPHSPVTSHLLKNLVINSAENFVSRLTTTHTVLICPDEGAKFRVHACGYVTGCPVVECTKIRNPDTGELSGVNVPDLSKYTNHDFMIVDDICDGGRTFINLAKELRKQISHQRLYLYVTHGIFSRGLRVFDGLIDLVYCPNPWPLKDNNGLVKVNA